MYLCVNLTEDKQRKVVMNAENELGKKIKELRKSKGFTQQYLAELADIDDKHLSKIENGIHEPTYKTLKKLSEVLDFELSDIDNYKPVQIDSFLVNNSAYQKSLKILQSATNNKEIKNYYDALKLASQLMNKKIH